MINGEKLLSLVRGTLYPPYFHYCGYSKNQITPLLHVLVLRMIPSRSLNEKPLDLFQRRILYDAPRNHSGL